MPTAGLRVLTIGPRYDLPHDVRHLDEPTRLMETIATFRPDVIVTSTAGFVPGVLSKATHELRKRWIHVDGSADVGAVVQAVENCYRNNIWNQEMRPVVSVYTPTRNTGDYLRDAYQSLREQTCTDWEWVVVDDNSTDGTWDRLCAIAAEDWRVRPFRLGGHNGKIGALKDFATRLSRGDYLLELDHDDMLTETAVEEVARAFRENPDVGMVYTNYAAFFENGDPHKFDESDPAWRGRYREVEYHGRKYLECDTPDIYDRFGSEHWQQYGWFLTVGPHHIRAYRAETLRAYGGYNPELPVADDWDVFARFFCRSRCLKIAKMLYLYRTRDAWVNTTFTRNKSIQDHLGIARAHHEAEFRALNDARSGATQAKADQLVAATRPLVSAKRDRTEADTAKLRALSAEPAPPAAEPAPKRTLDPRAHTLLEWDERSPGEMPPGCLLTIAVCTVHDRWLFTGNPESRTQMPPVVFHVLQQAAGKPVEVKVLLDNRAQTLSEKRNEALQHALGRYVAFVDDDDRVAADYVDTLLAAINSEQPARPDVVVFDVEVSGYSEQPKPATYGVEIYHSNHYPDRYYRKPNHIMCWRTEVARRVSNQNVDDDDDDWAWRASTELGPLVQLRVKRTLYWYDYVAGKSLRGAFAEVLAKRGEQGPATVCPYNCGGGWTDDRGEVEHACAGMLSFVVLDGLGTDMTTDCLRSIRKYASGAEIVLVGNGAESRAMQADPLRTAEIPLFDKYVQVDGNIRFGAGNNLGARRATRPYLCFFNDDAELVDEETPIALLRAARGGRVAGPYASRAKPPQGNYAREKRPDAPVDHVDMVAGLCLVVSRAAFDHVGGFDHGYRVWWDDDDLCRRLERTGYRSLIVGGTYVLHKEHATFKKLGLDLQAYKDADRQRFEVRGAPIRVVGIMKDEARAIVDFVAQWAPITSDVVLLDTGSTDRTREIARSLSARVVMAPGLVEKEGFAHARNAAAEIANSEWVIMTDIDERLSPHTIRAIPDLIATRGAEFDAFVSPLRAVYPNGETKDFVPKAFAYRPRAMHWECMVHEKLVGSNRQAFVGNALNEHLIGLHAQERRADAERLYAGLAAHEPYFTDPNHKRRMREQYIVLDYDMHWDDRFTRAAAGPRVTAVIATYKRTKCGLCPNAIESALRQDWLNLDVVVVGDACPEFAELEAAYGLHPRVRLINLTRHVGGVGQVPRNVGVQAAGGEWIAYLDDDNEWDPNHVSSLMREVMAPSSVARGVSWAMSSMSVDGLDCKFREPKFQGIDTSCVIHERELFFRRGPWRLEDGYAADWKMYERWLAAGEPWAATGLPTLKYNAPTSGQPDFIRELARRAQAER